MTNEYELYLQHHGVKGMKWGVRRKMKSAKASYKKAGKEYSEAYKKAYDYSFAGLSPFKKHRQANTERWEKAAEKAIKLDEAKQKYKAAKKELKADAKAQKAAEKALAKVEKQKYKDFVNTRSKEILAGKSSVGKVWDVITDSHRTQAKIEYQLDKRYPNLD